MFWILSFFFSVFGGGGLERLVGAGGFEGTPTGEGLLGAGAFNSSVCFNSISLGLTSSGSTFEGGCLGELTGGGGLEGTAAGVGLGGISSTFSCLLPSSCSICEAGDFDLPTGVGGTAAVFDSVVSVLLSSTSFSSARGGGGLGRLVGAGGLEGTAAGVGLGGISSTFSCLLPSSCSTCEAGDFKLPTGVVGTAAVFDSVVSVLLSSTSFRSARGGGGLGRLVGAGGLEGTVAGVGLGGISSTFSCLLPSSCSICEAGDFKLPTGVGGTAAVFDSVVSVLLSSTSFRSARGGGGLGRLVGAGGLEGTAAGVGLGGISSTFSCLLPSSCSICEAGDFKLPTGVGGTAAVFDSVVSVLLSSTSFRSARGGGGLGRLVGAGGLEGTAAGVGLGGISSTFSCLLPSSCSTCEAGDFKLPTGVVGTAVFDSVVSVLLSSTSFRLARGGGGLGRPLGAGGLEGAAGLIVSVSDGSFFSESCLISSFCS